jgi:calcium binding protein
VREGVGDPDSDVDISGWQGGVLEIAEDESGQPFILVAWDSYTLKEMPRSYLEQSEIEGMDWQRFLLLTEDIKHAQSRDTQRDVDEVTDEIYSRIGWYSLGEEGKRIQGVLSGVEDEWDAFKAWETYLAENLRFPFEAVVSEYQDEGVLQRGDRIRVQEISLLDDLYGVIVSGKWDRRSIDFPLCDLDVVGGGVNEQIVSDYALWFANR